MIIAMSPPDRDADAVALVQRQVDAFNAKDVIAFAACYAEDCRIFRPLQGDGPALIGTRAMIALYGPHLAADPETQVVVEHRHCHDGIVTDREYFPASGRRVTLVFAVRDGLIRDSWIFEARTPPR